MLKVLRHRGVQRKIFIGLAIAIIPSFVLVGVMTNEDSGSFQPLGTIGKHKISVQNYLDSYRAVQHQMQFMFGERWGEMRRYVNLKGEAWDRLLLYHEARRRGIKTADKEVVQWIASQPAFQRQGKYYPELYRMAVREGLRMEPRDFEEEMRQTLTVQKLSDIVIGGAKTDEAELKALYQKERAIRDIEYMVLALDTANPELKVEDQEVQQVYDMFKDRLTAPARVKLKYITIPDAENEAKKDILEDQSSGLEALAQKAGITVQSTAFFTRNDAVPDIGLSREILTAAFTLPSGGESPWIHHGNASFKIKVDGKEEERPLTFDEAREEIRSKVITQKATEIALKRMAELKPAADKDGLAAAAQSAGLTVQSQDGFSAEAYVPGIGQGSVIARQLAALKENEISAPLAVPGGVALVRVKKDHSPDDAAFEKDREEFGKEIGARKAQDAMKALLEKLRADLSLNLERMKEIFPEDEQPVS